MLKKLKSIAFYVVFWLAYYQIVDFFREPSLENQIKMAWSIFAGTLFAYVMGFDNKFRWSKKIVASKEPEAE